MGDDEVKVHMYTEEELQLTEDERNRSFGRMAFDILKMIQMGMPEDQARAFASLRYDQEMTYSTMPLRVNGVLTSCLLLQILPGKMAVFGLLGNVHNITTVDGEDISKTFQDVDTKIDKRTLN